MFQQLVKYLVKYCLFSSKEVGVWDFMRLYLEYKTKEILRFLYNIPKGSIKKRKIYLDLYYFHNSFIAKFE